MIFARKRKEGDEMFSFVSDDMLPQKLNFLKYIVPEAKEKE